MRGRSRGVAGRTVLVGIVCSMAGCGGEATGPHSGGNPDGRPGPAVDTVAPPAIGWIGRTPRLASPRTLDSPEGAGWPEPGQAVRWIGNVVVDGDAPVEVGVRWRVGGVVADSGTVMLPSGWSTVELPWAWVSERTPITLVLDGPGAARDSLTVASDALALVLWSTTELEAWMDEAGYGPFSVWAQTQVRYWNEALAEAGALDRIRLDRAEAWDDETWPPLSEQETADLGWWFGNDADSERFLAPHHPREWVLDQTIVLHELLHQRGLIDLYAYTVRHDPADGGMGNGSHVGIRDPDGGLAAGSDRMPWDPALQAVYRQPQRIEDHLMGTKLRRPIRISGHSVWGLNNVAGRRTPWAPTPFHFVSLFARGNDYAAKVPDRVSILVRDDGVALAETMVDVFFDDSPTESYRDVYPADPHHTRVTDGEGRFDLPTDRWRDTTWVKRVDATTVILRARTPDGSRWGYAFLPAYDLNVAYHEGRTDSATVVIDVDVR